MSEQPAENDGVVVEPAIPLSERIAMFNRRASKHIESQYFNPFAHGKIDEMQKRKFSKEEYGRPLKGSKTEARGFKATAHVSKEILQLCEIINTHGENMFGDHRKVISFGELFDLYTYISNKLVGDLLRARKYKVLEFEGEVLFQRKDDNVPIVMVKTIEEIREIFTDKISQAEAAYKSEDELV